jgi:hypothetical protein
VTQPRATTLSGVSPPVDQGPGIVAKLGGPDRESARRIAFYWKSGELP